MKWRPLGHLLILWEISADWLYRVNAPLVPMQDDLALDDNFVETILSGFDTFSDYQQIPTSQTGETGGLAPSEFYSSLKPLSGNSAPALEEEPFSSFGLKPVKSSTYHDPHLTTQCAPEATPNFSHGEVLPSPMTFLSYAPSFPSHFSNLDQSHLHLSGNPTHLAPLGMLDMLARSWSQADIHSQAYFPPFIRPADWEAFQQAQNHYKLSVPIPSTQIVSGHKFPYVLISAWNSANPSHQLQIAMSPIKSNKESFLNFFSISPIHKISHLTQYSKLEALISSLASNFEHMSRLQHAKVDNFTNEMWGYFLDLTRARGYINDGFDQRIFRLHIQSLREIFLGVWALNSHITKILGHNAKPEVWEDNSERLLHFCQILLFKNNINFAMELPRSSHNVNVNTLSPFEKLLWDYFSHKENSILFNIKRPAKQSFKKVYGRDQGITRIIIALIRFYYEYTNKSKFDALFPSPDSFSFFLAKIADYENQADLKYFMANILKYLPKDSFLPWKETFIFSNEHKAAIREKLELTELRELTLNDWLNEKVIISPDNKKRSIIPF
ncbi:hypothetical protein O181_001700 [Austropuccinia psidii MF-1]|uniref:Uncharacterized protein n=1 Tax=Austropuccinia psidii MF-1 TaxID=1389203 RepID=A0A9Q3BBJ1_9BASI|nr:hypothetical protein [Austropuccinia psidii MF-1]